VKLREMGASMGAMLAMMPATMPNALAMVVTPATHDACTRAIVRELRDVKGMPDDDIKSLWSLFSNNGGTRNEAAELQRLKALRERWVIPVDQELGFGLGQTMLIMACQNGDAMIVAYLTGEGARVDMADEYGDSPLSTAVRFSKFAIVQALLSRIASDPPMRRATLTHTTLTGMTPLALSALQLRTDDGSDDSLKVFCALVHAGCDVNSTSSSGGNIVTKLINCAQPMGPEPASSVRQTELALRYLLNESPRAAEVRFDVRLTVEHPGLPRTNVEAAIAHSCGPSRCIVLAAAAAREVFQTI
jgi:hypothetical protein